MTEHLIERGNRKIVFALPQYTRGQQLDRMHCSAADRVAGYRQAMAAAGLVPDVRLIEMGRAAIEMAIKIIEDFDTTEIPSIKFRPKLILGEST